MAQIFKPEWKRNYRRVPVHLLAGLERIDSDDVVVACVKRVSESEILDGKYKHLGIKMSSNEVSFPTAILPKPYVGKYSLRNVEGAEVTRKDLPMITKTFSIESL